MKHQPLLLLPIAFAVSQTWAETTSEQNIDLAPVVVTGTQQQKANTVKFNPKATLQPLPAGDGADLLKSVPNMSIIRKGGSSGDPLFRGLGGSRLSINADDQFIYGGCPMRMDPPTAYIFPNNFDEVVITKGPQSVTQGAGLVAGSVHFVRKKPNFDEQNYHLSGNTTLGSHDRRDAAFEGSVGGRYAYLKANIAHNEADDYKDGDGNKVHSNFKRDSQILQLGITPTENTDIIGTYERSRAQAAYADRMMDGSKFDRDAWNIRATQRHLTEHFSELELSYGQSKVDHVMDNYSLRTVKTGSMSGMGHMGAMSGMKTMGSMGHMGGMGGMTGKMASNPKRDTDTGHLKTTFDFDNVNIQAGVDYLRDKHSSRSGADYASKPYNPSQHFNQWGGFAELAWQATQNQKWVAGYRHDQVKAIYDQLADTNSAKKQTYRLDSGFARWEQQVNHTKFYAGFGVAERSPDYWERTKNNNLKPEQNRQIDAGIIWKQNNIQISNSLFASDIHDFILIDNQSTPHARNISARRFGGETEIKWKFMPNWEVGSSLAYTHGNNRTDHHPLAQTPPLEWKTNLTWDNGTFSTGALWRVVAKQNRFAKGQGNIAGQDLGTSGGFGVLSLNAGWRINKYATLQAGVDNVFNKTYAEFVSRGGNPDAGMQTTRVNEPGRNAWLRLQAQF